MNSQQDVTNGAMGGYSMPPMEASHLKSTASSRASGLGVEFAARQEMIRRHLLDRTFAAATASSTSGLAHPNHDAELELLIRRENELLSLRSAHGQRMAGLGLRINQMTAGSNEDSFRNESIEAIVALQEQRRKEVEEMMGLPGHQLGEQQAFNLLNQRAYQSSALAGMASSATMASTAAQGLSPVGRNLEPNELATASYLQQLQRRVAKQKALAFQNYGLAAMRNWAIAGQSRMPSSTLNYSNEYLHMLQQQQQLSLLQMQSRAVPGSLLTAGLNRTQDQGSSVNTQLAVANPPNLTQVLVRDRPRYYKNEIEGDLLNGLHSFSLSFSVDASGKPLQEHKQPVSPIKGPISKVQAHLSDDNEENLSVFVGLVLSHVPEMSQIMAGFLSSVKEMHSKSPAKRLSTVIDMVMDELNSIDQNDLMAIDPKCSDLASRVVACLNVIEAFRDETNANKSTEGTSLKPKSSKKEKTAVKRKTDDDLPLMQVYKRSKAAKKSAKNSSRNRPHEVGKDDKLDARLQNASKKHPKTDGKSVPAPLDPSELPKKQRRIDNKPYSTLKCNQALDASTLTIKGPSKSSNGPHGDLSDKLSSDGSSEKEEKGKDETTADPKSSNEKEGGSSDISYASSIIDNASDDNLSAAGALLGLRN